MEIKDLEWRDNITDLGKKDGLFEIISDVCVESYILMNFSIRNSKVLTIDGIGKTFFLWSKTGFLKEECFEFSTIEEAKEKAQQEFKNKITKLFFTT